MTHGRPAAWTLPLWAKRIIWHLNGTAGRSIAWRIKLMGIRYALGVALAKRICRGNRYGEHTDDPWNLEPLGGHCLCSRTRRRLDYIPF